MVNEIASRFALFDLPRLLAEVEAQSIMLQRLTPFNQLRVIMGLFVVVILGVFLFIVIKAGSHMVQGMSAPANRLRSATTPPDDDWAKKPLNELPDLPDDDEGE